MPSWEVFGQVQGVMFRQTVARALRARGLAGGASNDPANHQRVVLTIEGDGQVIESFLQRLGSGDELNSRGACVESLQELGEVLDWREHQVTTLNVDDFAWRQGVDFYL